MFNMVQGCIGVGRDLAIACIDLSFTPLPCEKDLDFQIVQVLPTRSVVRGPVASISTVC